MTDQRQKLPVITDSRLAELLLKIQPLVTYNGFLYRVKEHDPRKESFLWVPKLYNESIVNFEELDTVDTIHHCGFYGFYTPTVAEVFACLPEDIGEANAFYMSQEPIGVSRKGILHYGRAVLIKVN